MPFPASRLFTCEAHERLAVPRPVVAAAWAEGRTISLKQAVAEALEQRTTH